MNQIIKDRYEDAKTWQDRALIIQFYHLYMTNREDKWSIRETAGYFKISTGLVSEDLKLAKNVDNGIREIGNRKDAIKYLKENGKWNVDNK